MRISAKLSLGLFSIFAAFLLGATVVLTMAFQPAFSQLEDRHHAAGVARIEAQLEALREEMLARVRDYAEWDDTREFIAGRYPAYVDDNFSGRWLASYNIDLAMILDDSGRVLWQSAHDQNGAQVNTFNMSRLAAEARRSVAQTQMPVSGVDWTIFGPMVFSAMPATGTDGRLSPRGLVVFARRLDAAGLAGLAQRNIALIDAAHAPPALTARLQSGAVSTWTQHGQTESLLPFFDARGQIAGAVLTGQTRDMVNLGHRVIGFALLLFALIAMLACGVLWMLIRKVVVKPLSSLERDFSRPSRMDEIAPVADDGAQDEIGGLKRAYNQLVARVHESRGAVEQAQRERTMAEAANQMKSQFLANMSHELRTPLNAITGYAELILEQLEEAPIDETRGDLEKIVAAARHQLRLVNEVLDLARIESGAMTLEIDLFDGGRLIEDAARIVEPLASANGNHLSVVVHEGLGMLRTDAFRLKQCLINLAGNACKFTQGGAVSINARRLRYAMGEGLEVVVADTGIGMSDDQIRTLFQPFVQADASITRRFGGSGLGLAITRNVVRLLGGEITVQSTPGEGTMFTLVVPIGLQDGECEAPPQALSA